jgi:thermitase
MITRTAICFSAALVGILLCRDARSGEKYAVKPRPSQEKRLAPELDLVRHADCRFLGLCRRGRAVFDVPSDQAKNVQAMSVAANSHAPKVKVAAKNARLLISYSGRDRKPLDATLQAASLRTVEDYERGSFLLVEPEEAVSFKTVDALLADDAVVHAAPDYVMSALPVEQTAMAPPTISSNTPNDPYFDQLWGMQNIRALEVWPSFREAPNIVVAVIDTGVDYNHRDLKANMWSAGGRYGYDFFDDDDDPMDEQNHGTHCAGTIAGVGNNGVGVVGVNWKARIMALRFLGPDGSGSTSDAVKCIDWAVANGAHIISNSWAGPDTSPELVQAIARAEQKGVLFVAAAGNTEGGNNNDTAPYYPAAHANSNIITVAAIDANDAAGSFTHYGRKSVDIGAPGVGIVSTIRNNEYAKYDGTSMAAPHVAGAAALVWAKTFPSPAQDRAQMTTVRDLLYENARPVPALKGLWGYTAPARVPGGVLDISFLTSVPSNGSPLPIRPPPGRRALVEKRFKVDPYLLR